MPTYMKSYTALVSVAGGKPYEVKANSIRALAQKLCIAHRTAKRIHDTPECARTSKWIVITSEPRLPKKPHPNA